MVCVVPDAADLFALPKPEIGNTRGKLYTLNRFGSGVWVNGLGFGVQDLGWVSGVSVYGLIRFVVLKFGYVRTRAT